MALIRAPRLDVFFGRGEIESVRTVGTLWVPVKKKTPGGAGTHTGHSAGAHGGAGKKTFGGVGTRDARDTRTRTDPPFKDTGGSRDTQHTGDT